MMRGWLPQCIPHAQVCKLPCQLVTIHINSRTLGYCIVKCPQTRPISLHGVDLCAGSSEIPALNNPRAVQSRDTTRAYLEELMANRDKEPPSYDELADAMWLLPKPLPMTTAGFDSLPHSSLNAEDEHQGLVILTCDFPAQALGESVGVSLRRSGNTIDHGGKHAVMIATDWLAIGFMKEVLGFLRIPVTADTAGNIVDRYGETDDTTGDTPGLYQPDATLILQNMLMCKV